MGRIEPHLRAIRLHGRKATQTFSVQVVVKAGVIEQWASKTHFRDSDLSCPSANNCIHWENSTAFSMLFSQGLKQSYSDFMPSSTYTVHNHQVFVYQETSKKDLIYSYAKMPPTGKLYIINNPFDILEKVKINKQQTSCGFIILY